MTKLNCWESLNCGKTNECPAYPDHGRDCFAVTGTLCNGTKQGAYKEKIDACRKNCGFYSGKMGGLH